MKLIFLVCLLDLVFLDSVIGTHRCPDNEVYKKCYGCDQINKLEPIACADDCSSPGCYCKDGYIRECEGGACIRDSNYFCSDNEEYKVCGGCDQICDEKPISCGQHCKEPGCYCKKGYVRSPEGECVWASSCMPKCPVHEVYKAFGGCDQINNHEPISCTDDSSGCYCQDGYIRSCKGGTCIPDSKYFCPVNEEYKVCGGCDQICNKEPTFCAQYCHSPGCYCKKGYVRSPKGKCVSASSCMPKCPVNEIYKAFGGCDQINNHEPISCTDDSPGCYCKDGYIRSREGGTCIPDSNYSCSKNEEYKECGGCDQICNKEPIFCTQDCSSPGCYCKEGFIRLYKGGECVSPSKCYNCREDEIFKSCGVGNKFEDCCERDTISNEVQRGDFCERGCYCRHGYIRAGPSNKTMCVPKNECDGTDKCPKYEEYRMCGPSHQDSCDRKRCPGTCGGKLRPKKSTKCVTDCFCKPGFVREHDDTPTTRYKCIPEEKCPKPCKT